MEIAYLSHLNSLDLICAELIEWLHSHRSKCIPGRMKEKKRKKIEKRVKQRVSYRDTPLHSMSNWLVECCQADRDCIMFLQIAKLFAKQLVMPTALLIGKDGLK